MLSVLKQSLINNSERLSFLEKNELIDSKPSKLQNCRFTENWYTGYS